MRDAGGGGNRNLFEYDDVLRASGGRAEVVQFMTDIEYLVPSGLALRFFHMALRDHFALAEARVALSSSIPTVRDWAAWALWQIPDPRAVDLLIAALSDPYPYARGSAASALGRIGDPRAIPALRAMSSDTTEVLSTYGSSIADVAAWAIAAINNQRTPEGGSDPAAPDTVEY